MSPLIGVAPGPIQQSDVPGFLGMQALVTLLFTKITVRAHGGVPWEAVWMWPSQDGCLGGRGGAL